MTAKRKVVKTPRRSKREKEVFPVKTREYTELKSIAGTPITMEIFLQGLENRKYMCKTDNEGKPIEVPRTEFFFCQNLITGEWAAISPEDGRRQPKDPLHYRVFSFLGFGVKGGLDWSYDCTGHPWLGDNIQVFMTPEMLDDILLPAEEIKDAQQVEQ